MVNKNKAVQQSLEGPLDRRDSRPSAEPSRAERANWRQAPAIWTELSTTVFSAEPQAWVEYLRLSPEARYEPEIRVHLHLQREWRVLAFEAENDSSRWLAQVLEEGFSRLRQRLEGKPHLLAALDELLFHPSYASSRSVRIVLSSRVPSDGTRESGIESSSTESDMRIVLHAGLSRYVSESTGPGSPLSLGQRLGIYWPLVSRVLAALAYPPAPLDRFAAKIEVFAQLTYLALSVLYDGRKSGHLVRSPAGETYERAVGEASGIAPNQLEEQHPYFRMLSALGFALRGEPYANYRHDFQIAAREYLDLLYLRLSLSGAMPEVPAAMRAMSFQRKGQKVRTPKPEIGQYGVLDSEDLEAWKTVVKPFAELGFTLLRQLGMGEFGRVYEALNDHNTRHPARVALKVDRIVGKKKKAILAAEEAMVVGRELAGAPHLIRLYDTGKLRGERYTYHVLQLIDGETLDNLVGLTGLEHASVSRPPRARQSEYEGTQEYQRALRLSAGEAWRRQRLARPFVHALSPAMLLDLLTSVLLWLDEVHRLDYAINDLKNGNLMMSRRGQLKGIDLDSYGPVRSPRDKVPDFMFLAVSLVLLLLSANANLHQAPPSWEELIKDERRLRAGLLQAWPFGAVEELSDGRVREQELLDVLVLLVQRSRTLAYIKHPERFMQDVTQLVSIKRRLLLEELVID